MKSAIPMTLPFYIIKEDVFVDKLMFFISKLNSLFFHIGAILVSTTYLNSFGLIAPILIWLTNMIFTILADQLRDREDRIILQSLFCTYLPIRIPKHRICAEVMKTFYYFISLTICCLIVNTKYEILYFKYGEWTIWNNKQVNMILISLFVAGVLNFLGFVIGVYDKWSEYFINIVTLFVIYFVTVNVFLEENHDYIYVSFMKARNHTISIRSAHVSQVRKYRVRQPN